MEYIKVYVSKEEKECLTRIAKNHHLSVSQFMKEQCEDYLHPRSQYLDTSLSLGMCDSVRTHKLVTFVSEEEFKFLKKFADDRGCTISRFIREKLYEKKISIEIKYETGDLQELILMMSDTYRHLIGTAEGLMHRNIIYERDKERLLSLGYEIRDTLKEYVKLTYRNQNAIRKTAVRHLNKKIEKAINEVHKHSDRQ